MVLAVDGSFGFEMETFEFLNMCQVHHTLLTRRPPHVSSLVGHLIFSWVRLSARAGTDPSKAPRTLKRHLPPLEQVHGFPRMIGVLTHLDSFRNPTTLRRVKKQLKHRFWTDIYEGCKLFYLSGLKHGRYPKVRHAWPHPRFAVLRHTPLQSSLATMPFSPAHSPTPNRWRLQTWLASSRL